MVIFVVAALAGFLLFGWIKASPWVRSFFLNRWVQGLLGSLVLIVLLLGLIVLIFPSVGRILPEGWWSEFLAVRIVQDLTGTEAVRLILGVAFGCILRYWGPQFWEMRLRSETRYNWVAISLVGLLLLAAAAPYLERQFGGMTALKTPVAEFQFAVKGKAELPELEKNLQNKTLTNIEKLKLLRFVNYLIKTDLIYLRLFPQDKSSEYKGIYQKSETFTESILGPLGRCALQARENYLDIESIQHALQPIAQKLYLLIEQGKLILELQPQGSTPTENLDGRQKEKLLKAKNSWDFLRIKFLNQVKESGLRLKEALVKEEEKKKCELDPLVEDVPNPKVLVNAPHIYLVLAYLDAFNHNVTRTIFLLESASNRFRDAAPLVSFHINYTLAFFLYQEDRHDNKSIFLYLDHALKITREAGLKINQLKDPSPIKDFLLQQLELDKIHAENFLAFVSAEEGVRKFEALKYAKHNYENRNKLPMDFWPVIIDTYGYVKMAFEARKNSPNFDEITETRALFKEAIFRQEALYQKHLSQKNLIGLDENASVMKLLRAHLEEANKLLEYE